MYKNVTIKIWLVYFVFLSLSKHIVGDYCYVFENQDSVVQSLLSLYKNKILTIFFPQSGCNFCQLLNPFKY